MAQRKSLSDAESEAPPSPLDAVTDADIDAAVKAMNKLWTTAGHRYAEWADKFKTENAAAFNAVVQVLS